MVAVQILEQILNGLLVGAYYLLIALGLSLIFSLGGLVNLAHGAFYAIGAYLAVKLGDKLGFVGVMVASPVLVALLGLVIERLLFRRFYRADLALALHERRRGDQRRAGRTRGRAARADIRRASRDGRRNSDRGVRRRRDRRLGFVLGRRLRGVDRRRRARTHRLFLSVGGRSIDVPVDGARAAVSAARIVRRTHSAVRMSAPHSEAEE